MIFFSSVFSILSCSACYNAGMKILVINGSPKGSNSITLQTVLYLKERFSEHEWSFLNAAQDIKAIEQNPGKALHMVNGTELLLFSYPVYTFLVPSQLYRFLEILNENNISLKNKYAAQILTSKHFYDVTAMEFMKENLMDLGVMHAGAFSADMSDLLKEKGQKEIITFWKHLMWRIQNHIAEQRSAFKAYVPIMTDDYKESIKDNSKTIAIVTDAKKDNVYLNAMINRFVHRIPYVCDVINLHDFSFGGGCLGCLHCVIAGYCIYQDGFEDFLRNRIQKTDAIVYAFTIKDHAMGSLFKMYDDRQFVNGHRTVTMGKPMGYLVDGCLRNETNLSMMLEARFQCGGNIRAGIACDEKNPDQEIDQLVMELSYVLENNISEPMNFYGVGGGKIFRDLVYDMRGLMKADHAFYQKHHLYDDLPGRDKKTVLAMYAVGALMKNKKIQKAAFAKMSEAMIAPYQKIMKRK